MRKISAMCVGVLLFLLGLSLGNAHAQFQQGVCGQTIYYDTTLTQDIIDCPGDGIIIGYHDITLDCADHRIIGLVQEINCDPPEDAGMCAEFCEEEVDPASCEDQCYMCFEICESDTSCWEEIPACAELLVRYKYPEVGINVDGSYYLKRNITIKNCVVENFKDGMYLKNAHESSIIDNKTSNNSFGIRLYGNCYNNAIKDNDVFGNREAGIELRSSHDNTIADNAVSENMHGITITDSSGNRIEHNTVNFNLQGIYLRGFHPDDAVSVITDNTISSNEYAALMLFETRNTIITMNLVSNNGYGIYSLGQSC